MQHKVDYLSISLPYTHVILREKEMTFRKNPKLFAPRDHMMADYLLLEQRWLKGGHFAPFSEGIYSPLLGCTYMTNPKLAFSLIQFTGAGCDKLREQEALEGMLEHFADRVTVIDIASDIETATAPEDFIKGRLNKRFQGTNSIKSLEGQTEYVGSWNSDRFVKVYRYNPPHPRAALLRVEYRQKRELAVATAKAIVAGGVPSVAAALGKVYGWVHEDWQPGAEPTTAELSAMRSNPESVNTERWLFSQVLPALRRLKVDGSIEALKLFRDEIDVILGDFR